MKRLISILLEIVGAGYCLFRGYQGLRDPSSATSRFSPYLLFLLGGVLLLSALSDLRKNRAGLPQPSYTWTRVGLPEKILFKAVGTFSVVLGLGVLCVVVWATGEQWVKVARWPRTEAVLVTKDISQIGIASLVFQYEISGVKVTGREWRLGQGEEFTDALESYAPGTVQKISYNPDNPGEVQTILSYNWRFFRLPVGGAIFCSLLIVGGVASYRCSYGWRTDANSSG